MCAWFLRVTLSTCLSVVSVAAQDRMPWPGSVPEGWLGHQLDTREVQGIIDSLNEESKKQHGQEYILEYHLDLGPLNRVEVHPKLWGRLTVSQRRQLGNRFAEAFKGSGLLFCQFLAADAVIGKVKSDPIRGELEFETVDSVILAQTGCSQGPGLGAPVLNGIQGVGSSNLLSSTKFPSSSLKNIPSSVGFLSCSPSL